MLTADMKRLVGDQPLGFVATVSPDGTPNLSPKGTFAVIDDRTLAFADIRSPQTIRNLKANPRLEVNFVDPFVRKGYRFSGAARLVNRGEKDFEPILAKLRSSFATRVRTVVVVTVEKATPLTSPSYDDGRTEAELRKAWTARFRKLQPGGTFEE
jgi:predicted pyridoxine 5'-phosphate oxidase superfamily flavin-nucleotide-binding protein